MVMMNDKQLVWAAGVLGVAVFLSALVVTSTLYKIRSLDNTFSVTGSAKQSVKADHAKLTVQVTRSAFEGSVPEMYAKVEADAKIVAAYFEKAGIEKDHIIRGTVFVDQEYSNDANAPRRYTLREGITIDSGDVQKIDAVAHSMGSLVNQGITLNPSQPEYFISNLPELRVSLLGEALKDARARAAEIAQSANTSVGALKSAASGVVQVSAPNSIDVSDYGNYDTSSMDKDVMVTVRATFLVQ
jgi:hypothetical protein